MYDITGGARPGNGPNLFHSFGDFSIGALDTARFLNTTPELVTSNIIGRVTGGNPSNLFGTIDTLSYGNTNLFLMNPAGIVFGPNATLNIGGSVTFTTANYLRLTDTGIFHADPSAPSVLTSAPVAAFGFLGSDPGAIIVQGSQLSVLPGQDLSLIAGDITLQAGTLADKSVQPARLTASGGQINLVSIASPGEVSVLDFMPTAGMTMGNIHLSQEALVDVSADAAGTIRIRAGQLVLADGTISADTGNTNGAVTAIDIQVTGDLSISDTRGVPALTARTTGLGDAGDIHIVSANLEAASTVRSLFSPIDTHFALIDTHTTGSGKAGNVTIETSGDVNVTGQATGPLFFIDTGTIGFDGGHGGDVTITAENIRFENANISTGDSIAINSFQDSAGSGGNVTITADSLSMTRSVISTDGFWAGRAGDLTINVRDINMNTFSGLSLLEFEGGGRLTINADRLIADSAQFDSETVYGPGGGFTINARVVELRNGTTLRSQTVGDGDAGDIRISATDHITLIDRFTDPSDVATLGARVRPTGLYTNSLGNVDLGTLGNAGSIILATPRLEITGGARINSTTQSNGHGGDVVITATNQLTVSGERPTEVIEEGLFGLGSTRASGIYTRTVGSEFCFGPCGNAGNVFITTSSMNLSGGAVIDSGTTSNGRGGNIAAAASDQIILSGTSSDGSPSGIFSRTVGTAPDAGAGGNISLAAGQSVTISDGAAVSAGSTGPADAGNIFINAGRQLDMRDSSITTTAAQASGGNIDIQAIDRVSLVNSTISTSVLGGSGSGGNITIDPTLISLESSRILAQAVLGNGGNIRLVAGLLLVDPTSVISASSEFGQSGTIQSPTSNLAGSVGSLPSSTRQGQALQAQRCALLNGGEASSFLIAGRDQVPTEPDGWMVSSLAPLSAGTGQEARGYGAMVRGERSGARGERDGSLSGLSSLSGSVRTGIPSHQIDQTDQIDQIDEPPIPSLRRLTPAGFLTQHFAEADTGGCRS